MSHATERFLDAATRPLADDLEQQIHARRELGEMIPPDAAPESLEHAAERLEKRGGTRWRWIWAVAAVALSVLLIIPSGRLFRLHGLITSPLQTVMEPRDMGWTNELTDEQRLMLDGKMDAPTPTRRWRPLWESDPDNPAYFIEYALAYEREHQALPPGFLETGRRIDPGNGWYLLNAATIGSRDIVETDTRSKKEKRTGVAPGVTIHDPAELEKRVVLLLEIADTEHVASYQREMLAERFELFPEPDDFATYIALMGRVAGSNIDINLRYAADLIVAEAKRCLTDNDREGFQTLADVWELLFDEATGGETGLIDAMIAKVSAFESLPAMRDAAAGLKVDPDLWTRRERRVRSMQNTLDSRKKDATCIRLLERHGGVFTSLGLPSVRQQVMNPPELTKADLLPNCRVNHAVAGRVLTVTAWLVVGLACLGSIVSAGFQSVFHRRLTRTLTGLWSRRDALRIGLGGVVAPILVFLLLRYVTQLGRLDWNLQRSLFLLPGIQFTALALMLLVWPVVIAKWRLGRIGGVLGWDRGLRLTIAAGLAPVIAIVLSGLSLPLGSWSMPLWIASGVCLGFSLIWLLAQAWKRAFAHHANRLPYAVIADGARPAWLGALLALGLLTPFFAAQERHWLARDQVTALSPSMTVYEGRVADQLLRETRKALLLDAESE